VFAKHVVNILCEAEDKVQGFIAAIENLAKIFAGEWAGSVKAVLVSCKNRDGSGKRQAGSSEIETQIVFEGPYAETTGSGVTSSLEDETVDAGDGVSGEFLEASSPTGAPEIDSGDGGLSGGAIAGIVVGCVVGATLLVVAIVLALRHSKIEKA